jgi:transcriptional regulator GlxA family with amidase domain
MDPSTKTLPRIAILALPGGSASVIHGMYDLFAGAGRDWVLATRGVPGPSLLEPCIVSVDGAPVGVANGLVVTPHAAFSQALIDWQEAGQQPFASLTSKPRSSDAVIARSQQWLADHYREAAPVAAMAEVSGLPLRSFSRRFAKATGMAPLAYVHTLRLEEAKHMLEAEQRCIAEIAEEVGYEDAGYFTRLFRRQVGISPAQYRRRFGGLRRSLVQNAGA